jgi:serine/threonine protein phosphatase PrpC
MRLGQHAGLTDAGRKRRRNEDAYVVDPPLFVVADGMGGAQAGEVASRLAAAAFREFHDADGLEPKARLAAIVQEANRRIYERSQEDAHASGMGTTITAALLGDGSVAIGHVGDSRAYRIRDGRLEQLTEDHSLVAELVRSGRLTPEEAETHPQRSVITRVLGTDPDVDVDTFTVETAEGDVYLICSDGLTSMVPDEEILRLVAEESSIEQAARALVKAANRHGGEDNITVVLFTLAAGSDEVLEDTVVASNGGAETDLEDTLTGLEPVGEARHEPPEPERAAPHASPARRGRRRLYWVVGSLAFTAALLGAALLGLGRAYFVGGGEDGRVTVYQGLPWDLGGGVELYRPRYVSRLLSVQLSPAERERLFDHALVSYEEALDRVRAYETEAGYADAEAGP